MLFSDGDDLRAYQHEWALRAEADPQRSRPFSDPLAAANSSRLNLGVGASLVQGVILDGVAYTGAYRVALERGKSVLPCVLSGLSAFGAIGARTATSLPLGTTVWVIRHPQLHYGVIVATQPDPVIDGVTASSPQIHQASRCGLRVDDMHTAVFRLAGNGGVADWSAGRPFDGTLAGEWGAITETGARVLVDSFLAQLGVDEMCGVFAHYHDLLLRLAGHNLQIVTAGTEDEILDDGGEIQIYRGETPFHWEAAGALRPGVDPFRDLTAEQAQISEPHYSAIEPVTDDQMPMHRVVTHGGYLGQGGRRSVFLPPASGDRLRYSDGAVLPAVFEETTTLSGRHVTRSAKGIWLVKQPAMPGPRRVRRPEDPAGDAAAYDPCGLSAAGAATHHAPAEVGASTGLAPELQSSQRAASVLDTVAYACNWEGVHPFYYHARDWALPEESAVGKNHTAPPYRDLATVFTLAAPAATQRHVDHRVGDASYYPNTSLIGLEDDGSVVIRGGQGEAITLAGGTITFSAPGDIFLKSGRDVVAFAGFDVILRAKQGVEASATTGGVRVKADRDVQILAGNSGDGALLLESRGASRYDYADKIGDDVHAGGVHIRAPHSEVVTWAKEIYLRTGGPGVDDGRGITLDAGRGSQPVYVQASSVSRYLRDVAADYFGPPGLATAVNLFAATANQLGSGLLTGGGIEIAKGGLSVQGNIAAVGGISGQGGRVGKVDGAIADTLTSAFADAISSANTALDQGNLAWSDIFAAYWYGKDRPGSDAVVAAASFSFRTSAQYKASKFAVFEDPWQQAARLGGGAPAVWIETPVRAGSATTYPYPGKERWKDASAYYEQDLTLVDLAAGAAKPRDPAIYATPHYAPPTAKPADGHYAVIF